MRCATFHLTGGKAHPTQSYRYRRLLKPQKQPAAQCWRRHSQHSRLRCLCPWHPSSPPCGKEVSTSRCDGAIRRKGKERTFPYPAPLASSSPAHSPLTSHLPRVLSLFLPAPCHPALVPDPSDYRFASPSLSDSSTDSSVLHSPPCPHQVCTYPLLLAVASAYLFVWAPPGYGSDPDPCLCLYRRGALQCGQTNCG